MGSGRHGPDPKRVEAIQDMVKPETKKKLHSFLELANYYRDYVSDYSRLALPLTDQTAKCIPQKLTWTMEAQEAFQKVKSRLAQAPALFAPDQEKSISWPQMPRNLQTEHASGG